MTPHMACTYAAGRVYHGLIVVWNCTVAPDYRFDVGVRVKFDTVPKRLLAEDAHSVVDEALA